MKRLAWLLVPLATSAGMLAQSGCVKLGEDGASDDAGTAPTVESQCVQVVGAFCSRANACYGEDPRSCLSSGVETCCGNACASPATSTQHAIDTCVADLERFDCELIVGGGLPERCDKVVKF